MSDTTLTQRIADAKALLAERKALYERLDALAPEEWSRKDELDYDLVPDALAALVDACEGLRAENVRLRKAFSAQNNEICQTLGKVLGYPWFKDDQKNFPGATEENGVCVGDHVAESIAMEAARTIVRLRAALEQITRRVDEEGNDNILACGLADIADDALRGAGEGT